MLLKKDRREGMRCSGNTVAGLSAMPPFFKIQASDVVAGLRVDKHYLIDLMLDRITGSYLLECVYPV